MLKLFTRLFASLIVAAGATASFAQPIPTPASAAAPASGPEIQLPYRAPVIGSVIEYASTAESVSDMCEIDFKKQLIDGAKVVVVRRVLCKSRYGTYLNKDFLEILHNGARFMVLESAIKLTDDAKQALAALDVGNIMASMDQWKAESILIKKAQVDQARKAVDATAKFGVGLGWSHTYDVSEHTQGTGYTASVYNSTKKVIKYVTFSVIGLNAVGDPVKGPLSSSVTKVLQGIGPIAPGDVGTYSKDYMWMTDIVESVRLVSIKVDYMDGTSKLVTNIAGIKMNPLDYNLLTEKPF